MTLITRQLRAFSMYSVSLWIGDIAFVTTVILPIVARPHENTDGAELIECTRATHTYWYVKA
jgi:hypothetical protein